MPLTVAAPWPHAVVGTPCGYWALNVASPAVVSESSAAIASCGLRVARQQAEHRAERVGEEGEHALGERAVLDVGAQVVGERRALVRAADRGHRGDQIGTHRGDVAHVEPAVAVADQVDLGLAGDARRSARSDR